MWLVLIFISTIPQLIMSVYVWSGFNSDKFIESLIVLPNHTLWVYVMSSYAFSIFFMVYCMIALVKEVQGSKPKPILSKAEIREMLMNGELN